MDGELKVYDDKGELLDEAVTEHPSDYIKSLLIKYKSPRFEDFPTFTGGLVGYFAYDYIKYSEKKLKLDARDEEGFKDVDLMLFDRVICFDNLKQKIIVIANASTTDFEASYEKAKKDIDEIISLILNGKPAAIEKGKMLSSYRKLFEKDEFCDMVDQAKEHIFEGDIFQVVLSNRLVADFQGSLFDTYRVLRTINPSPYMFYFSGDDIEVAGASPETLVKCEPASSFALTGSCP